MSDTKLLTKSKPESTRRLEVFTGSGRAGVGCGAESTDRRRDLGERRDSVGGCAAARVDPAGVRQDADRRGHRPLPFDIWTNRTYLLKPTGPATISLSIGARATENPSSGISGATRAKGASKPFRRSKPEPAVSITVYAGVPIMALPWSKHTYRNHENVTFWRV